jgi:hypothetical protein
MSALGFSVQSDLSLRVSREVHPYLFRLIIYFPRHIGRNKAANKGAFLIAPDETFMDNEINAPNRISREASGDTDSRVGAHRRLLHGR